MEEFTYLYANTGGERQRLICMYFTDANGFKPTFLHCHTEFEFMLIISGNIRVVNNNTDLRVEPPCILLHRPYTFHVIHAEQDILYERYHFYFNMNDLMKFAEWCPRIGNLAGCGDLNIYKLTADSLDDWRGLLNSYLLSNSSDEGVRGMYTGIALGKMLEINAEVTPQSSRPRSYIQNVIEYIHLHIADNISLDELSERFYVSRSKLIRDFARYASCSIHEYITLLRLDKACLLLRSGKNVTNTAMECGFNYVSSFIRLFKLRFGMSPLKYSEQMRENR